MRRHVRSMLVLAAAAPAAGQPTSVVNSPHNLSASGTGAVRATAEEQVCIFCHAPHNSAPVRPLWNRATPVDAYTIYTSRSLEARPGQPTGASKMCLSCHDGTIALGSVISRGTPIEMAGAITTMPPGASNLGTDLSDDHPISFRYDGALASHNLKLKDPGSLPPQIRLDANSELQCTSCHDAHNNSLGKFLVMRNENSELCISCHQNTRTTVTGHQNCSGCHQPHTAPSGPYLLKRQTISDTCMICHGGTPAPGVPNLAADLNKPSIHDTHSRVDPPPPLSEHASCTDCHEPHSMSAGAGAAPGLHPNFGRVAGVSASGSALPAASAEFEVCYKCHAEGTTMANFVPRRITQPSKRLQFSPSSVSYHPVEAPGRNTDVPSLKPGWTTGSMMYCSSCHTSDSGRNQNGSGPNGTHGSLYAPLLAARYETADFTSESAQAYALCYQCHDRSSILSDRSFPLHQKHIVEQRTPCAACHDAHGISSAQGTMSGNSNLINFATAIVHPDRATGRLEFIDTGTYSGQCFLSCHGVDHSPMQYPQSALLRRPGGNLPGVRGIGR